VAVGITRHGLRKPDNRELARNGENDIAHNAQKTDDLITAALNAQAALAGRLGQAEANIRGGLGTDIGLSEDPLNPGTYFMADASPIQPDPDAPGLYTF
jgi:hypothetical protein